MNLRKGIIFVCALIALFVCIGFTPVMAAEFNAWREKTDMPTARRVAPAIEVSGKIYVIGGWDGTNPLKIVEEYDPVTDTWTTKSNMPTARYSHKVAVVNDKIYAFGGRKSGDTNTIMSTVEEYDIATDTWTTKENMPTINCDMMVAEFNGKVYTFGGYFGRSHLSTVYEYDPIADTWTTKTNMPTARYGGEAQFVNGKIYVIGGRKIINYSSQIYEELSIAEEYNPITDTWTTKTNMPTARVFGASVMMNNKIYVMGGRNGGTRLATIEEYDATTDTWATKVGLSTAKDSIGAAAMNGRIYVFAGYDGSNVLNTVEESCFIPDIPTNLTAIAGSAKINLNWNAVEGAESYIVKRSTTAGGPYVTVAESVYGTSYPDTDVTVGTTYYYVVRAIKGGEISANSNEASATPEASAGRALLVITMQNGLEKEYDLSMSEVEAFISWYNGCTGNATYTIDKNYNVGPFVNRKDYIVHDKIMCFEVMEYVE